MLLACIPVLLLLLFPSVSNEGCFLRLFFSYTWWESVPTGLFVSFAWILLSKCTTGIQLVSQACLALFDLYTSNI
jgi:hypothetical protein